MKKKPGPKPKQSDGPITRALRRGLEAWIAAGGSYYQIRQATKIAIDSLTRFAAGETDLTTATADKLAQFLGLRMVEPDNSEIAPEDVLPEEANG